MIDKATLASYKIANSPRDIIYISFKNKDYIFRSITNKEFEDVMKISEDDYEKNELICQIGLLYPAPSEYNFSECGIAGLPEYVAPIILDVSNVLSADLLQEKLEEERIQVNSLYSQAFIAIKLSFPEITIEKYEEMSWNEILKYVALSEKMIQYKQLIDQGVPFDLNIINKNEEDTELTDEDAEELRIKEEKRLDEERKALFETLYENGIDAVEYFNLPLVNKGNVVEKPIIGGLNWNNEEIINEIGKKIITKRKER